MQPSPGIFSSVLAERQLQADLTIAGLRDLLLLNETGQRGHL